MTTEQITEKMTIARQQLCVDNYRKILATSTNNTPVSSPQQTAHLRLPPLLALSAECQSPITPTSVLGRHPEYLEFPILVQPIGEKSLKRARNDAWRAHMQIRKRNMQNYCQTS